MWFPLVGSLKRLKFVFFQFQKLLLYKKLVKTSNFPHFFPKTQLFWLKHFPGVFFVAAFRRRRFEEVGVLNQLAKTAKFETNKSSLGAKKPWDICGEVTVGSRRFWYKDLCFQGVIQWFFGGICHVK